MNYIVSIEDEGSVKVDYIKGVSFSETAELEPKYKRKYVTPNGFKCHKKGVAGSIVLDPLPATGYSEHPFAQ